MNYDELASKVRAKHPGAYDDMDDQTLARKIIEKHPEYSDTTFNGVVNPPPGEHDNLYPDTATASVFRRLPEAGGFLGGFVGSKVPGPAGLALQAAGSGLGAMIGETANQAYQGLTGSPFLPKTTGGQLAKIGKQGLYNAGATAAGGAIVGTGKALGIGKFLSRAGEMTTGTPARTLAEAGNEPTKVLKAYLPEWMGGSPSMKTAQAAYGKAVKDAGLQEPIRAAGGESGIVEAGLKKITESAEIARNYGHPAPAVSKGLGKGIVTDSQQELNQAVRFLNVQEAYEMNKANQEILKKLPRHGSDPQTMRHVRIGKALKSYLGDYSKELETAAKMVREAAFGRDIKKVLPVNKYGDYSIGRIGFFGASGLPAMLANPVAAAATYAVQSPAIVTGASALAGPVRRSIQSIIASQKARE